MGYFSEMSLDMQESRKPSAAPLTRESAFEEGESFDELPVPPADRQPVPPAEEPAPQPAFEDDEDLSEVPKKQGQPDEAGPPAEETDDGDNADEGQAEPAKADTSNTDADEEKRRRPPKPNGRLSGRQNRRKRRRPCRNRWTAWLP